MRECAASPPVGQREQHGVTDTDLRMANAAVLERDLGELFASKDRCDEPEQR